MLVRDRTGRMIRTLVKYGYVELIAYSLVVASEMLDNELFSVSSTLASKQMTQCLDSMNEEMKSLHFEQHMDSCWSTFGFYVGQLQMNFQT